MSASENQACAASNDEMPQHQVTSMIGSASPRAAEGSPSSPLKDDSAACGAVAVPASPTTFTENGIETTTSIGSMKANASSNGTAPGLSPVKEHDCESTNPESEPTEMVASVVSFHVDSDIVVHVSTPLGTVLFKVSSGNLVCASSVWATQLYRTNLRRASTDDWMVEIHGDVDALTIIFSIVHFKFNEVPVCINLDGLYEIALVFSEYDCAHLAYPWASKWIESLSYLVTSADLHRVCHKALFVAWVFGDVKLFRDMADALVISSELVDGELANVEGKLLKDMVLPLDLFDFISKTRRAAIAIILRAIEKPFKHEITDSNAHKQPLCKASKPAAECEAMMLGSVIPRLMAAGLFPAPDATTFPRSIYDLKQELASVKPILYKASDAKPHQYGDHYSCNLGYDSAVRECLKGLPMPLQERHMEKLAIQATKTGVKTGKEMHVHLKQCVIPSRKGYAPGATIDYTLKS
ncbi:hypothetical protein F5Y06DRAFT_305240 [Hypoxylon sp. FL0890]|nr:hypothetical protein F5Y06DRAFT_305240 [Hypoxylon sp. FL0890]